MLYCPDWTQTLELKQSSHFHWGNGHILLCPTLEKDFLCLSQVQWEAAEGFQEDGGDNDVCLYVVRRSLLAQMRRYYKETRVEHKEWVKCLFQETMAACTGVLSMGLRGMGRLGGVLGVKFAQLGDELDVGEQTSQGCWCTELSPPSCSCLTASWHPLGHQTRGICLWTAARFLIPSKPACENKVK